MSSLRIMCVIKNVLIIYFCLLYSIAVQAQDIKKMSAEVDAVIYQKIKEVKQKQRAGIDDYTFARRVYVNAIGRIPTLDELKVFIADKSKDKRSRLIAKLLNSKGYNSHIYNYWAELLRVKSTGDKLHHAGNFSEAIKSSIRVNKPYDVFVRELVDAKGELYKPGNGLAGFKARETMQLDRLANTVKTFLGIAVECAQCHDHPFDDWTQKEFYKLAAFTSQVHLRVDPVAPLEKKNYAKIRKELKHENFDKWIVYREALRMKYAAVHGSGTGYMRLPHDYQYDDGKPHEVIQAKPLFGTVPTMNFKFSKEQVQKTKNKKNVGPHINAQQSFAQWISSRENSMFTKATINRLWHWVMGTELVGPVSNLELGAEGKHPELTNKLVKIMKNLNYDTRKFFQVIFNTKAFQSKALALGEKNPEYILDGPIIRRLSSEAVWDSLLSLVLKDPDQSVPVKYHYDGFTHFYEKSQKWTAEDFKKYSRECGHNRAQFYQAMHKEAAKRNPKLGSRHMSRASEAFHTALGNNYPYYELANLFGASPRELIDSSNTEPNIPQVLYMMNGKPEFELIKKTSYFKKNIDKFKGLQRYELIWLSIYNRPMKATEKELLEKARASKMSDRDVMWGLLNSNEFRFLR